LGWLATTGWAQPVAFGPQESRYEYQLSETVQLDRADSAVKKQFEQASACLADKQWSEAIDLLVQLVENWGGKLYGVTERRYVSVRDYCHLKLASLPEEALTVYRTRVDAQAKKSYEEGVAQRDPRRLMEVVDHAFAGSWGGKALDALAEMALESGDYAAARAYWENILPVEHPPGAPRTWLNVAKTDLDLNAIRARLVLASILEGSLPRAREELTSLAKIQPTARGRLGGREVNYVEALATLLDESRHWPQPPVDPDWPTFAGSPARNKTDPQTVDAGGVTWRVSLPPTPSPASLAGATPSRRVADDAKTPLSYHPVVVGNLVFVHNQVEILAIDLRTGQPAWGHDSAAIFQDPFDDAVHEMYHPENTLGLDRFTMTVHNGRLYARMGSAVSGGPQEPARITGLGYLVGLDLSAEGRLAFPKIVPEDGWSFEGSPVADDSGFYVAMRRSDVQPQRYVACFDPDTGQRRWRQFVCAAETPARSLFHEIPNNLLTLHHDTLYFNTNSGAVAALATRDGRIQWLSLYPRVLSGNLIKQEPQADRDLVPCLYDRGTLLVAPSDSRRILAFDAATGQILWQTGSEVEDVVHLLGVAGDYLIASGRRLYWIGLDGAGQGQVKYVWPDNSEKLAYGRGILAKDCVWWPIRDKIYLFDAQTGRLKKEIPLAPRRVTGGNLLIAGGQLLIATGNELVALGQNGGRPGTEEEKAPATASKILKTEY
jgi:outer membrane protein assembly factor BamB